MAVRSGERWPRDGLSKGIVYPARDPDVGFIMAKPPAVSPFPPMFDRLVGSLLLTRADPAVIVTSGVRRGRPVASSRRALNVVSDDDSRRGFGSNKANRKKLTNCCQTSTTGSPKGLIPRTCKTPRRCWSNSSEGMNRRPRQGFVATLPVIGIPLCFSPDCEGEEERYGRF